MKKYAIFVTLLFLAFACGESNSDAPPNSNNAAQSATNSSASDKGVGDITSVKLNSPLDENMVVVGQNIYDLKCAACHKLSDKRVVGPGWAGVTDRRKPEWIMNMVMNVEEMLEKDPVAKQQLKECLVRMPNQNLSEEDARSVLEFMFKNDEKEG